MRMELYRYNRSGAVSGLLFGLPITLWLSLPLITLIITGRYNLLFLTILAILFTLSASITIYASAAYLRLRRDGIKNTPLVIVIDDAGLWSQTDGNMPWSEIQAIEWVRYGKDDFDIIVVWRHQRYSFRRWRPLMDGNGKGIGIRETFDVLKACWERNRGAAAVSAEPNRVAPSGS